MRVPWLALAEGNLSRGLLGFMGMKGEVFFRLAVCRVGPSFFPKFFSKM
jgi:hypothetical protein